MPRMNIKITRDGKIIVDAEGYIGLQCIEEFDRLSEVLKALGVDIEVKHRELKEEAYITMTEKEKEMVRT